MSSDNLIKRYLSLSILSAVGNSCAEWALFFYALKTTGFGAESGLSKASLFFIGSGVGKMLLAPLIGVMFDRFSKKTMSMIIDSSYALLLILSSILFSQNLLNDFMFLGIAVLIQAFAQVHIQAVGFATVKLHASTEEGGRLLALMNALSTGLGVGLSGIVFAFIGFYGCMAFGVLTFIPMIVLYPKLFALKDEKVDEQEDKKEVERQSFLSDFVDSFKFLIKDKILIRFGLILGFFNVVGALFPAFLKVEVNKVVQGNDYLSAVILASGLIIATIFFKKMDLASRDQKGSIAFALAFLPILLAAIVAYIFPGVVSLSVLYLTACFGSGLRNIVTAGLRRSRVPKEKISRVNTLYGSLLNIGPLMGGLFVIPVVESSIEKGLIVAISFVFISILLSLVILPKESVAELSREVV